MKRSGMSNDLISNTEFSEQNYAFDLFKSCQNVKINKTGFKLIDLHSGTILSKRPFFKGYEYFLEIKILHSLDISKVTVGLSHALNDYSTNFLT